METVGTRSGEQVSTAIETILHKNGAVTAVDLADYLRAPVEVALYALERRRERQQLKLGPDDKRAYVKA